MPKVCKECGHQMDDNVQVCPNCGCPVENASESSFVGQDTLTQGKSTLATSIIIDVAETILKWGNIISVITSIFIVINSLITGANLMKLNQETMGIFTILIGIVIALLCYCGIRLLAKACWGTGMLFVNMSATLNRIEKKLEENGTH